MSLKDQDDPAQFSEGRYVYCVVAADAPEPETGAALALETGGVEGEPVYAVEADGIAAIVHECESLYDSDDLDEVHEWLLDHQAVVDEAGEAFGTPLPFRFDTIVRGDDDAVREWLEGAREDLEAILDDLAGYWEYRVEIARIEEPELDDERLDELREEVEEAGEGRAFLLEKQLENRRREIRRERDEEIAADAQERLEPFSREIERGEETDVVGSFSLLVHEDDEEAVGEGLDAVADREGIEVRFTGPWPPYSFVPELEG